MSLDVVGLVEGDRVLVRAKAPTLLVSIEAAVVKVRHGRSRLVLDRAGVILLPRGTRALLRAASPSSRIAVLSIHEPLVRQVARAYKKLGVEQARLAQWLAHPEVLPRTLWVHEIVHRYVFERYALDEHDNAATRFLETEIVKEIYFLFRDREEGKGRATTVRRHSVPVERAIAFIEAHLFEVAPLETLSRHAGASESTLLRSFRRELGSSPGAYWRNRALDEALVLLRTGRHSVSEVASRVGYESPTSFGFAFRRRFEKAPSSFIP